MPGSIQASGRSGTSKASSWGTVPSWLQLLRLSPVLPPHDLALHPTGVTPISTQASLSLWSWLPPAPPSPLTERDDKRMSKHAVASLGQRAQTLALAVENGGEEAEQKASELGESVQWAAGSYKPSSCNHQRLQTCFHAPAPPWSSAHSPEAHLLLKNNTKR